MKTRWLWLLLGLGFAFILATVWLVGQRKEPVYQGKALRYWVTKLGSDEYHGAPKDAVKAVRAIGPEAVPFLLEWMPHRQPHRPAWIASAWQWCSERLHMVHKGDETPTSDCIRIAWWVLGSDGKSAIPALARVICRPPGTMDDYSAWTDSAEAISHLGPGAILPMLTAATNMHGQDELWELLHHFENLGTNGAPAIPALIQWAKDPNYFVRSAVVSALGGIGKRPDLALPVILAALHDSNSMVRRDAAEALGAFAGDSDAVLPELTKIVNGNDAEARGGAVSGLGRIRSRPEIVVPLIAAHLSDEDSVVARSAAYALLGLEHQAGYQALLQSTNNDRGLGGIRDIIFRAIEIVGSDEEEERRQEIVTNLARIYDKGEAPQLSDPKIEGKSLSEILSNKAITGPPLRLIQILALREVATARDEGIVTFELPLSFEALTNIGAVRLLCDADPSEKVGNEALVQECRRATNGDCLLVWDTSYDPPGRHFLQAELMLYGCDDNSRKDKQAIRLRGPLFAFVSTNALQFFPHADSYTDYGAFFRVKVVQPVGAYSIELTSPSGEHIHTLTGSITNRIVEVSWDLLDDGGKRCTNDSFNATWTVTFPDATKPGSKK